MATQNPLLPIGQWVQYNASFDDPRSKKPSSIEQTVGMVRQSFTDKGEPYYQVVWMPGDKNPKVGFYHADQLTCITNQQANDIITQIQQGTWSPQDVTPGSQYQPANLPTSALPPQLQGGTFAPSYGANPPALTET